MLKRSERIVHGRSRKQWEARLKTSGKTKDLSLPEAESVLQVLESLRIKSKTETE